MALSSYRLFLAKLDEVSPSLRRAFDEAVADLRSVAQAKALEAAIEAAMTTGDWQRVLMVLHLDAAFWAPLDKAMQDAFDAGAVFQLSTLPKRLPGSGAGLVVRFDGRHPRAEAASRTIGATLVRQIDEDTRRMVRETITEGVQESRPPAKLSRDLIGYMSGNQRKGGLLGLTSQQAGYVRNMRRALSDPTTMGEYLSADRWTRKDKRFMRTVAKAQREGRALTEAEIRRATDFYSDSLLRLRGEVVARTETLRALNAGRAEGVAQMIESGEVPESAVTLVWQSTPDRRTRDTHRAMNGQAVRMGQPFMSPSGAMLSYPGDPSAPAAETINCRCSARARVDWVAVARARGTL